MCLAKKPDGTDQAGEAISICRLHSTVCVLMTQFQSHRCPKLSHMIVNQLRRLIEHRAPALLPDDRAVYIHLLSHWQQVTLTLIDEKKSPGSKREVLH